jgi:hypothetical protein
MRQRLGRLAAAVFLLVFAFSGCAYMTKSGRQEMAFRHYVNKHIRENRRRTARAQKAANRELKQKLKFIHPSEPIISATVESSAPTSDPNALPPPAPGEVPATIPGP